MNLYYEGSTFDDSSVFLSHHGILGMKWGVRRYQNKDGSLTPAGRERYSTGEGFDKKRDTEQKAFARKVGKVAMILPDGTPEYKEMNSAADKLKEVRKVEEDFYENNELWKKYAIKAAKNRYKEIANKYPKTTEQDIINWYLYDDGDQGQDDSFNFYMEDKGSSRAEHEANVIKAYREYDKAVDNYIDSCLGRYKDKQITVKDPNGEKVYSHGIWRTKKIKTTTGKYLRNAVTQLNSKKFDL